jgi:hypothetical protein
VLICSRSRSLLLFFPVCRTRCASLRVDLLYQLPCCFMPTVQISLQISLCRRFLRLLFEVQRVHRRGWGYNGLNAASVAKHSSAFRRCKLRLALLSAIRCCALKKAFEEKPSASCFEDIALCRFYVIRLYLAAVDFQTVFCAVCCSFVCSARVNTSPSVCWASSAISQETIRLHIKH